MSTIQSHGPATASWAQSRPAMVRSLMVRLNVWRTRRALARLSAEQLNDVGITPAQAGQEAAKRFWDVPAHWRT